MTLRRRLTEKLLILIITTCCLTMDASADDRIDSAVQKARQVASRGPFQPTWESLENYEIPEWYKDAKFGIFIHWGVYCVPALPSTKRSPHALVGVCPSHTNVGRTGS